MTSGHTLSIHCVPTYSSHLHAIKLGNVHPVNYTGHVYALRYKYMSLYLNSKDKWNGQINTNRPSCTKLTYQHLDIWLIPSCRTMALGSTKVRVKVKCTLVQALRLCTGRTTHRGSRGIAVPFHDHGTRRGEGSASRLGRSLPLGKTRYSLYRRLGGPQGRYGQVRKISPPTGIQSPDRPASNQSLYRLSYPAHGVYKASTRNEYHRYLP